MKVAQQCDQVDTAQSFTYQAAACYGEEKQAHRATNKHFLSQRLRAARIFRDCCLGFHAFAVNHVLSLLYSRDHNSFTLLLNSIFKLQKDSQVLTAVDGEQLAAAFPTKMSILWGADLKEGLCTGRIRVRDKAKTSALH